MPNGASARRIWSAPSIRRSSSGMVTMAMTGPPADGFEQELENLDVPFGVRNGRAPGVETVAAQQKTVRIGPARQEVACLSRQPRHVLIVFENRQPFPMRVGANASQSLQHLVAFNRKAA